MTVVIFAQQADSPVDVMVRRLAARNVPVFRTDISWFPRRMVLDARLSDDGSLDRSVVRKSLGHNTVTEGGRLTVAYTHRLTTGDLADLAGADTTATQAQQWVDKTHEARVVVVGQRMFTILIRAGSAASRVDWRADYPALSYEWVDTPSEVEKGLRAYLTEMGLTYAAVDFAIDATGRWVFLESNSSGQYFWLESHTGAPITSTLADVLTEGATDHDRAGPGLDLQSAAARWATHRRGKADVGGVARRGVRGAPPRVRSRGVPPGPDRSV